MKELKSWKKVLESDLESVLVELKEEISEPAVFILTGDLGAGKTTFTKIFAKSVLYNEKVLAMSSPTYSLVNEWDNILHADFYRLKNKEELNHLELPMYAEDKDFIFVEWGKDYEKELKRLIGNDFNYYELKLDINKSNIPNNDSRNYILAELIE